MLGLCVAYGGMTWLSVQFGLRGWRSQIPGLVVVTGAYFVSDLAGRGDLGEFVAVAAVPLLLAAGRSVFVAQRVRARDLIAVIGAVFLLSGSNNITLLSEVFCSSRSCSSSARSRLRVPRFLSRFVALAGAGLIGGREARGSSSRICATAATR